MIRVVGSVGTDHHPFGRLLDWIAAASSSIDGLDAFVQRGATPPLEGLATVEYVAAAELEALMLDADVVVCHGGPGSIFLAVRCGHRPIVVARDPALGEHIDDHQMRYTARMVSEDRIDVPADLDEFIAMLRIPRPRLPPLTEAGPEVAAAARFGELVDCMMEGTLRRRRWSERILLRRMP